MPFFIRIYQEFYSVLLELKQYSRLIFFLLIHMWKVINNTLCRFREWRSAVSTYFNAVK